MVLVSHYREWSLFYQVQILFISVSLVLCGLLILITKYQLDWMRDQIITNASDAFKSRLYTQIENIGNIQASYLESELTTYEDFTLNLAQTDELINGFNKNYSNEIFQKSNPHSHNSISSNPEFSYGVYYSKLSSLSSEGSALVKTESILNNIYPTLYQNQFQWYYQGYYTDQILNIYPGTEFTSTYSPLPREWFYRGAYNGKNLTFTEPYTDATTGDWIMSVSRAVMNESKVFGVAACDIGLDLLLDKFSRIKVLKSGFGVLVSATGIVLTVPEQWTSDSDGFLRIFDTTTTSIELDTWFHIRDAPDAHWIDSKVSEDKENEIKAADYKIYKKNILPWYQTNYTHYLLIIVYTSDLDDVKNNLEKSFDNTYQTIFIVVYSVSIVVFGTVFAFSYWFWKKYTGKFMAIEKLLGEMLRKGFFTKVVKHSYFNRLRCEKYSGFESFKQAVYEKIDCIEKKELDAQNYTLYATRPNDTLLYDNWLAEVYPRHKSVGKQEIWDTKVNKIMSRIVNS